MASLRQILGPVAALLLITQPALAGGDPVARGIASSALAKANAAQDAADTGGVGQIKRNVAALNSNTIYAAGLTTYSAGTYTAPAGAQPLPSALAAGQVFFVRFDQANTGSANLQISTLAAKPLKVVNSVGTALTLIGGEIVPGPATVYYDGTQFIYSAPAAQAIATTTATALTQANFSNHDTFYLTAGAQTLTLPCDSTLSPNGQVFVFSVSGAITINTGGSCASDTITKNGVSGTSTTVAQGAAAATITTDGVTHFYVSGS